MNIAVIICEKSAASCSGYGCFMANVEHRSHFEEYYPTDPASITAFFHCGGCESITSDGEHFVRQFEQLNRINLKRIHLSSCVKNCPHLLKIQSIIEEGGFSYIIGTH